MDNFLADNSFAAFLMQLVAQAPLLLAYLVGFILALALRSRYPGPALLTLIATALLLVISVAQPFVFLYIISARAEWDLDHKHEAWMLSVSTIIGSTIRAASFVLLLAAVFSGRRRLARPVALPEPLPRAEPALGTADEHGITHRPGNP
jgi:hypothetical protein